jgi:hypothetical protein
MRVHLPAHHTEAEGRYDRVLLSFDVDYRQPGELHRHSVTDGSDACLWIYICGARNTNEYFNNIQLPGL